MSFQIGFLDNQLYRPFLYCFEGNQEKKLIQEKKNCQLLKNGRKTIRKLIDGPERLGLTVSVFD